MNSTSISSFPSDLCGITTWPKRRWRSKRPRVLSTGWEQWKRHTVEINWAGSSVIWRCGVNCKHILRWWMVLRYTNSCCSRWRVLEISDVILIVMDIRNPLLHFPRSLYKYVTHKLKRKIIGIFNKVDLVSEFTVFAWTKYFEEEFPNLRIATFSCYPRDPNLIDDTATCKFWERETLMQIYWFVWI